MTYRKLKPKNQWALVVLLLLENHKKGVTMVDAVSFPNYFHKFQTRLGELMKDRSDKLKIVKLPVTMKNRFGNTMTFNNYKSLANERYLINLFNKLNKDGFKKSIIKDV